MGLLFLAFFLYFMYQIEIRPYLRLINATEELHNSRGDERSLDSPTHSLLLTKESQVNPKMVHLDVKGSDEDYLRAVSQFGTINSSCTTGTSTCVGTLIMVNRGAIDLYRNFLHYLAKLNLNQYDFIVCTSDEEVSSIALSNNQRVIMVNNHGIEDDRLDFGTIDYQMAISLRTRIINLLLQTKIYDYWLVADVDSVWLCNPFEKIFDEVYVGDPFDVGGQVDFSRICGGFLVLRSCPKVQNLWNNVTVSYQDAVKTSSIGKGIEKTEQGILDDFIVNGNLGLEVREFSREFFPSGFDYFNDGIQHNACVVHNNYIIGIDKKVDRFKAFNLWMDESTS